MTRWTPPIVYPPITSNTAEANAWWGKLSIEDLQPPPPTRYTDFDRAIRQLNRVVEILERIEAASMQGAESVEGS